MLTLLTLLCLPLQSGSFTTYADSKPFEYVSNYDGDTLTVNIPNWPPIVGVEIPVRVYGIDCPEMVSKSKKLKELAVKAKQFVTDAVKGAKTLELRNVQRDKYFRLLADVYLDDKKLADGLIEAGLAKPYDGGTKSPW